MIILFIILGLVGFCVIGFIVLGFLGFRFFKTNIGPMAGCMVSFQVTRDAVLEYAQTHDGKLPNAETWQDDVKEILRKRIKEVSDQPVFETISPDGDWGCKHGDNKMSGIAFNSDLSEKSLKEVQSPWSTPLIFEIEAPRRNAHEKYVAKPVNTSPTMMGEHRGWVVANVEGEVDLHGGAGRWRASGDGTPAPEDKAEEKGSKESP